VLFDTKASGLPGAIIADPGQGRSRREYIQRVNMGNIGRADKKFSSFLPAGNSFLSSKRTLSAFSPFQAAFASVFIGHSQSAIFAWQPRRFRRLPQGIFRSPSILALPA
jgi:hypothetical protein